MANKLPKNLYRFCREISTKRNLLCVYKSVKKTDKYRDRNFILNSKPVFPEIYTGVWFDDGLWDHRGDGDFWWTTDAKIFVIAKVGGRFYVPDSSSFKWEEVHDDLDDCLDIINDRGLAFETISHFDEVKEQSLNNDVQLTELYQKVKLNNVLFSCINKYCSINNLVCVYSGVHELPHYFRIYESKYFCDGEEIQPTKIYEVSFYDKNSKVVGTYDNIINYIIESNGKYYIPDVELIGYVFTINEAKKNEKLIHLANKNKLLPTKITKIGKNLKQSIDSVNNVKQL
ncbi:MAG: hypothetical protein IJ997_01630 [Mycoplasmataceae bacterium]|nr:hypothetical protein [Mycoplasmataceae bacterium]